MESTTVFRACVTGTCLCSFPAGASFRAQAIKVMGRGWTIRNDRGEIVGQVELKSTNAVVGRCRERRAGCAGSLLSALGRTSSCPTCELLLALGCSTTGQRISGWQWLTCVTCDVTCLCDVLSNNRPAARASAQQHVGVLLGH
jgi:hypothetical protein